MRSWLLGCRDRMVAGDRYSPLSISASDPSRLAARGAVSRIWSKTETGAASLSWSKTERGAVSLRGDQMSSAKAGVCMMLSAMVTTTIILISISRAFLGGLITWDFRRQAAIAAPPRRAWARCIFVFDYMLRPPLLSECNQTRKSRCGVVQGVRDGRLTGRQINPPWAAALLR